MAAKPPPSLAPAIPLYGFQRRWLQDKSRFKIGMFARQTGKTFTTTLEIVDDCAEGFAAGQRRRWVILSRGERQAREAMNEGVKKHARAYQIGFKEQDFQFDVDTKALEVELEGGSVITALPANPATARGYSANVFLDEFAFHENSRQIWAALFPVISAPGLKLRITSTPNGKDNKFYELMTAKDATWSRHQVDIHQAVADGLPRDVQALRDGLADEEMWSQEYELQFLDVAGSWLTFENILACEHPGAGDPDGYQGGPCYVGVDIARRRDLWVAWVWEEVGDVLWCREIIEIANAPFAAHDAAIDYLFKRYRIFRLAADQTGMGEKPVEDWRRKHGSRVEGVLMSGPRKLEVATVARGAFEDRQVRIPAGNPVLRADLHKIKRVASATGAPRLVADRDGDGHADRAWAAWLGIAAADGAAGPFEFVSSGQGRASLGAFAQGADPMSRFGEGGSDQPAFGRVNLTGY
jgi:phage FluMu gp28-like protein